MRHIRERDCLADIQTFKNRLEISTFKDPRKQPSIPRGEPNMQFNVDPRKLNSELAKELKEKKLVSPPAWSGFVKTGSNKERQPVENDWWYNRSASVLRYVARKGPIGTSKLSVIYGGRKNRGVKPDKFQSASTNILRKCLQQLEKAGLVHQVDHAGHKGRALTKSGNDMIKKAMERSNT